MSGITLAQLHPPLSHLTPADFAHRLGARRAGPGRWMFRCPAHDDRHASLSIAEGRGERILIHCFAGCDPRDVLAAMGLSFADLGGDRASRAGRPSRPTPVDWRTEWKRMPRRLARAVVEGPPEPETREQILKAQYRETVSAYRELDRRIDAGRLEWIPLFVAHEAALDEIHRALCRMKRGGGDALRP